MAKDSRLTEFLDQHEEIVDERQETACNNPQQTEEESAAQQYYGKDGRKLSLSIAKYWDFASFYLLSLFGSIKPCYSLSEQARANFCFC